MGGVEGLGLEGRRGRGVVERIVVGHAAAQVRAGALAEFVDITPSQYSSASSARSSRRFVPHERRTQIYVIHVIFSMIMLLNAWRPFCAPARTTAGALDRPPAPVDPGRERGEDNAGPFVRRGRGGMPGERVSFGGVGGRGVRSGHQRWRSGREGREGAPGRGLVLPTVFNRTHLERIRWASARMLPSMHYIPLLR